MAKPENYNTKRFGTNDAEIKFGHIHQDNNMAAFIVRSGHDSLHYITMDATGEPHRKHGTICRSPGSFQIKAGDNVDKDIPGVYIDAVSGDLVLKSSSGRVRIEGVNVDIIATGGNGKNGNITLDSNEKIILDTKIVDIKGTASCKIFSDNTVTIIGNAICDIYGGFVDIADGATKIKGSKGGSSNEDRNRRIV